jgi:hypothetical protein
MGEGRGDGFVRFAHVAFVWVDLETSEAFWSGSIITPRIGGLILFFVRDGVLVIKRQKNEDIVRFLDVVTFWFPFPSLDVTDTLAR